MSNLQLFYIPDWDEFDISIHEQGYAVLKGCWECPYANLAGYVKRYQYVLWRVGISIPRGYVVHHKDGNRLNDDPVNLQVLTREAHAALHAAKMWKDPVRLKRMSEKVTDSQYNRWSEDSEYRQRMLQSNYDRWKDPTFNRRTSQAISDAMIGRSSPKYCSICGKEGFNAKTHSWH